MAMQKNDLRMPDAFGRSKSVLMRRHSLPPAGPIIARRSGGMKTRRLAGPARPVRPVRRTGRRRGSTGRWPVRRPWASVRNRRPRARFSGCPPVPDAFGRSEAAWRSSLRHVLRHSTKRDTGGQRFSKALRVVSRRVVFPFAGRRRHTTAERRPIGRRAPRAIELVARVARFGRPGPQSSGLGGRPPIGSRLGGRSRHPSGGGLSFPSGRISNGPSDGGGNAESAGPFWRTSLAGAWSNGCELRPRLTVARTTISDVRTTTAADSAATIRFRRHQRHPRWNRPDRRAWIGMSTM